MIRKHIYYSGRVQGVGFRYTTSHTARPYDVTGYVRNLSDGRVEVVVEGTPAAVESFLDDLSLEMHSYITDTQVTDEPFAGEFTNFDIRF